jgi:hypothetical protein
MSGHMTGPTLMGYRGRLEQGTAWCIRKTCGAISQCVESVITARILGGSERLVLQDMSIHIDGSQMVRAFVESVSETVRFASRGIGASLVGCKLAICGHKNTPVTMSRNSLCRGIFGCGLLL